MYNRLFLCIYIRFYALLCIFIIIRCIRSVFFLLTIAGQFDEVASTTVVSIGSQVMHMLTVMIVGLATATGSLLSVFICIIAYRWLCKNPENKIQERILTAFSRTSKMVTHYEPPFLMITYLICASSCASSHSFFSIPPAYPVRLPSLPMTR